MVVVTVAGSQAEQDDVDPPSVVRERLEAFAGEVLAEAMNRPVQACNGGLYLRGLLEDGARKSLEPLVARLGEDADYQSMQRFLAHSPWDPASVVRAVAERVAPVIGVEAWVLDDTGFPKDGKDSPGVKRQYSGTLGKTGNCQIGVSVHAVGARGTVPLGWALYLPEGWCEDVERRRKAKIPSEVELKTKPELGVELVERAARWDVPSAPVLGDHATVRTPGCVIGSTRPAASTCWRSGPRRRCSSRAPRSRCLPRSPARAARHVDRGPTASPCRSAKWSRATGSRKRADGHVPRRTRRRAGHLQVHHRPRSCRPRLARERGMDRVARGLRGPAARGMADSRMARRSRTADRLLDLKPARRHRARAARQARAHALEDGAHYKQLKGELGLDHYEGRSWLGWYHHTALVTAAHGFLTLERVNPFRPRPA